MMYLIGSLQWSNIEILLGCAAPRTLSCVNQRHTLDGWHHAVYVSRYREGNDAVTTGSTDCQNLIIRAGLVHEETT